jgi:hypothetical protein
MARGDSDRGVRRLAAQLGLSAHVLPPVDSASEQLADELALERPRADEAADEADEVASEVDELSHEENEEEEEDDPAELSMGFGLSDSASEELSSDLSLPHSFGHYDGVRPAQAARAFSDGVSQFDDHLVASTNAVAPPIQTRSTTRTATFDRDAPNVALVATEKGSGVPATGSEALMKKFYEAQVGRVRAQLVLATQNQRGLERMLQQERVDASSKLANLEVCQLIR